MMWERKSPTIGFCGEFIKCIFSGNELLKDPILSYLTVPTTDGLWNALDTHYWWQAERKSHTLEQVGNLYSLGKKLWVDYFKSPLDTMPT
ncbi:MAG: hypothetical protein ACFFEE_08015, partial [Candidatus Thorarchaeota archaeon]